MFTRFRIVKKRAACSYYYQCQIWRWWHLFWIPLIGQDYFATIEDALNCIDRYKQTGHSEGVWTDTPKVVLNDVLVELSKGDWH